MKYILCNWLGVVNPERRDKNKVLEDIADPIWQRMGWFYLPESYTRYDGIRQVITGLYSREIRTKEDLEYYEERDKLRTC